MAMKPEVAVELQNKALVTFLRTDAAQADTAEVIRYEEGRHAGQYVIVRKADEVVAVYKLSLRMGPARATRTEGGGVAFVASSMSTSLKRLKRWPKDLLGAE